MLLACRRGAIASISAHPADLDALLRMKGSGRAMSASRIYLDHNATSPLRAEARTAMLDAFSAPANPSSIHQEGRKARSLIETARDEIARFAGASARDVVFTSGGTEALNLALTPGLVTDGDKQPFSHLLMSGIEHAAVREGARSDKDKIEIIPVDRNGLVDLDWIAARLKTISAEGGRVLVAVQAANNETGVIEPIAALSQLVHAERGLLLSDAVQVAGKLPLDQITAGADIIALSAHKIGGPQGIGALVLKSGGISIANKLLRGGGQERGARAGTENVAGIAGFAAAAKIASAHLADETKRLMELRDATESHLKRIAPDCLIFSKAVSRLPNTIAFAVPGLSAETALMAFDLEGAAISSGSACSSGKVRQSHVLAAMGIDPDVARGALRVSFGYTSNEADMIRFIEIFERVIGQLHTRTRAA